MRTNGRGDVIDNEVVSGSEIVDLGRARLDDTGPVIDLGLLDINPVTRPERPGPPRSGLPPARGRVAIALTFMLGLAAGAVAVRAGGDVAADAPLALEAGTVTVTRDPVPIGPSVAVVAVAVPVHNTGQHDIAVLSIALVAWQSGQPGWPREPVSLAAGRTRTVASGVQLDCEQPRPPTASVAEVRVRTGGLGIVSMTTRLPRPAHELTTLWQEFCQPPPPA